MTGGGVRAAGALRRGTARGRPDVARRRAARPAGVVLGVLPHVAGTYEIAVQAYRRVNDAAPQVRLYSDLAEESFQSGAYPLAAKCRSSRRPGSRKRWATRRVREALSAAAHAHLLMANHEEAARFAESAFPLLTAAKRPGPMRPGAHHPGERPLQPEPPGPGALRRPRSRGPHRVGGRSSGPHGGPPRPGSRTTRHRPRRGLLRLLADRAAHRPDPR